MILAVETLDDGVSMALGDGRARAVSRRARGRRQDEKLEPVLSALLRASGRKLAAADAVAAASGPGRFTSVRVGLTYAVMLGRALGKPAVAVSGFEAVAARLAAAGEAGPWTAVFPGRAEEFYVQRFRLAKGRARPLSPPRFVRAPELGAALGGEADLRLCGPGAKAAAQAAGLPPGRAAGGLRPLSASDLIAPALERLGRKRLPPPLPLYLKPAEFQKGK